MGRIRSYGATLIAAVREESRSRGSNIAYRRFWAHLQRTGLKVQRQNVHCAILLYDPDGISKRKSRKLRPRKYYNAGPNYA